MPDTKDTTQEDAAMQDAELFFQNADHRLLLRYIDDLAEYAGKCLDDYEALQKKVKRLERELQQEKDANALLQTQARQQGHTIERLERELQQPLVSRLWRIPALRKRIIHDALARGIFFPPRRKPCPTRCNGCLRTTISLPVLTPTP